MNLRTYTCPLRRVTEVKFWTNKYCRPGEGRLEHVLECGHSRLEKQSYGRPKAMRCRECDPAEKNP